MSESWFRDYVCLQFRMDKVIRKFTKSRFVDYYYGPPRWKDPFREAYIFTYFYGRQLMKPWLQGSDRQEVFKRFLTEQLCPSDLQDGWAAYQAVEPHYQDANRKLAE